jgi:glycosyltransferase involved in cell wall biosynthesis
LLPEVIGRRGKVDVVLGSFAYPDGWAAVALSRWLGVPAVIKVHGGDINELSKVRMLRPHLRWALSRASAVVATSRALADAAIAAGARADTTSVIFNGVDLGTFRVRQRAEARRELGRPIEGRWILFVGRIEARKGVRELMHAFAKLSPARPDTKLVLVGDGTERAECETFARERRLPVVFAGARPHDEVAVWLGACNVLALPSHAEGTPNVVIEALVSGRRVVASRVGGIPAVVDRDVLGALVPAQDVDALEVALACAIDGEYRPQEVAEAVSFGGWRDSARALHDVLAGAIDRGNPVPRHRGA